MRNLGFLWHSAIIFLLGVTIGFILFSILYKPPIIEVPIIRYKTITNTIEKPVEVIKIYREKETIPYSWHLFTFRDSTLEATFEAKTDSVRNFKYHIFKIPEIIYKTEMVKLEKNYVLGFNTNFQDIETFFGYKFITIGVRYQNKKFTPQVGVLLKF